MNADPVPSPSVVPTLALFLAALALTACGSATDPTTDAGGGDDIRSVADLAPPGGDGRRADRPRLADAWKPAADLGAPRPQDLKLAPDQKSPPAPKVPLKCNATTVCNASTEDCCSTKQGSSCVPKGSCKADVMNCLSAANCGVGEVCCFYIQQYPIKVTCVTSCSGVRLCTTDAECNGVKCLPMGDTLKVCDY